MKAGEKEARQRDHAAEQAASKMRDRLPRLLSWAKQRSDAGDPPRAFIVEFAGMPKAGKSSAIETIRHYFSHGPKTKVVGPDRASNAGYRVHTPAEGVSLRTPNYLKQDPTDFNTWAGAYALQELLQARHEFFYELVILDRGPWDASCWLEQLCAPQPPDDSRRIYGFFRLPCWQILADLHVVLVVDPKIASHRERDQRLIDHRGPASDQNLMTAMRRIYETNFKELQEVKAYHDRDYGSLAAMKLDTTELRSKEVVVKIIDRILDLVEAKLERNQLKQVEQSLLTIKDGLAPYEQSEFDNYAPLYLRRARSLTHEQRTAMCRDLSLLRADEQPEQHLELFNRLPVLELRQVQDKLDEILRDATGAAGSDE